LAPVLHRRFQLQVSGFVPWHGGVRNIILLHTHTWYFLNTSLTVFLFTPLASHTQHAREPRNTYICWVLFQFTDMHFRFQYVFHDVESRISTWYLSHTDIAECWLRNEYSVQLNYEVGTSGSTLKSHIISAGRFTDNVCLFVCLFVYVKLQLEL
jgi:hypothetical protein